MKKTLLIVFYIIIVQQASAQIPAAGQIVHYAFSGNARDTSGNGNHGNKHGVTLVNGKSASNGAYRFSTDSSYISIPYNSSFNATSLTMCAYIRPDSFYTGLCQGNYIIARGSSSGAAGGYILHYYDNPYNDCNTADTNKYVFSASAGPVLAPGDSFMSATKVHTNQWYCFVATYQSSKIKVYVDGVLTATSSIASSALGTSSDSITIGKFLAGGPSHPYNFKGVIDDIAIYNRVLADSEILGYCNKAPKIGTTGIENVLSSKNITIYPNPNNGCFNIEGTIDCKGLNIEIVNLLGVVLYRDYIIANNKEIRHSIKMEDLPNGHYILRLKGDNSCKNIPFIKQE
jgi:hypothetical protein